MRKALTSFGRMRTVRRFLWWPTILPLGLAGLRQLRWLETATIWQEYKQKFLRPTLGGGHWVDTKWTPAIYD